MRTTGLRILYERSAFELYKFVDKTAPDCYMYMKVAFSVSHNNCRNTAALANQMKNFKRLENESKM